MRHRALALALVLAAAPRTAVAQFGYFGQNKVQYQSFSWQVLHGQHVDLYFYPDEQELARVALAYAEESYGILERRFRLILVAGVNRIVERPMIRDGLVVARKMMNLSSSFDHRVVDGMVAAQFVQAIRGYLECPATLFVE